MSQGKKLKPMSNTSFRLMTWLFNLNDHFFHIWKKPEEHIRKAPVQKGMTVVDYACGPGRYTIPLAEMVGPRGRVYAVDIQPLAIKTVRKKAAGKSLNNIKAILVDSYQTGIPGSSADLVILVDAIQSIKDPGGLLAEIHRILKPDGMVFMDAGHLKTEEVARIVEHSGIFTIIKTDNRDMLLKRRDR